MTLTKAVLVENLCSKLGINKREAIDVIESFYETIAEQLCQGRHVKLSGFGNFILRDKGERPGRNPKTGQMIPVSKRRVVTFRAGLKLKKAIENSTAENSTTG